MKDFEDYLLEEYSNISKAHFKTIETFTSFFRYYLILMAIPISVISLFKESKNESIITLLMPLIPWVYFVISFVGISIMLYIIHLRFDAILYARTINSIRKYFYDGSSSPIDDKIRLRVLPQSPYIPDYHEIGYFWPVIFTFGFIDSLYFYYGLISFYKSVWMVFILPFVYLILHFLLYYENAEYRETGYLRSHIIGIDIDGVLNDHREHFCNLLKRKTGKVVEKDKITIIPVHECPGLGVVREDENKVFNDPEYWIKMPLLQDVSEVLRKIKNQFNFKLYIFSHRPWPNITNLEENERRAYINNWKKSLELFYKKSKGKMYYFFFFNPFQNHHSYIRTITKLWLSENKIKFNKLIIEKGNEDIEDPQGHIRNRFYIARKRKIKFFIEDDHLKAKKLSYICDIVFLLKQPYNSPSGFHLPNNVIVVDSWKDLYNKIKEFI
jgi:uncharacterized HAD superfamily protein